MGVADNVRSATTAPVIVKGELSTVTPAVPVRMIWPVRAPVVLSLAQPKFTVCDGPVTEIGGRVGNAMPVPESAPLSPEVPVIVTLPG